MSDDQAQNNSVTPPSQTPVSDQSVSSSSPVSADSVPDTAVSDQSADSTPLDTNRPEPTVSADLSAEAPTYVGAKADSFQSSQSPVSPLPTDLSAESQVKEEASAKAGSSPPENPAISEEKPPESPPQQPDLSAEAPTYVGAKEDINASPSDNQASQVQSEPSDNASTIQAENAPSQSAEIKPEPPESPTIPSNPPPSNSQLGKTISFGDLLSGDSPPSPSSDLSNLSTPSDLPISSSPNPQPTTNNQQPSISFGDLIKDIEITPPPSIPEGMHQPVRPEAERPIEQSQPTPPPPPPPQTQPQASPAPPPFISPISPLSATQDQAKERLTILQQKGNQRKKDKRQAILQKIIDLTKTKGKINNQEAQKIFHLPQSTLSDYFKELVLKGILKKEGKGKATYYHL